MCTTYDKPLLVGGFLNLNLIPQKPMLTDTLTPQIELLQEQIESIERSGHFTEAEIDSKTRPLRMELEILQHTQSFKNLQSAMDKCASSFNHFLQGVNYFYNPTDNKNIEVIDAEILTPNHISA
jgi:hypothetical protein